MEDFRIKKVCAFNVSSIHFSIMILPYINKELNSKKDIITVLENNLEDNVNEVISKILLSNEEKEKILNLNWMETDIEKMNIKEKLFKKITNDKDLCFVIYGGEKYINKVNKIINEILKQEKNSIPDKKIKIINNYKVKDFKENISEILDNHDVIVNTSGEHKKEEIFINYNLA